MIRTGVRHSLEKLRPFAVVLSFSLVTIGACEARQTPPEGAKSPTEQMSLAALCGIAKNNSDKCPAIHNFVEVYDHFLGPMRGSATSILEIGVLAGESMHLWADYFSGAMIHGIDIEDKSKLNLSATRHRTYIGDQSSRDDLRAVVEKAGGKFDLILDDGGHTMEQQQVSMGFLFPYVKSGGYYILEDVHTSLPRFHKKYGVELGGRNSTLTMINRYNYRHNIESKYMTEDEAQYITKNIHSCSLVHIAKMHSMAWICKKK